MYNSIIKSLIIINITIYIVIIHLINILITVLIYILLFLYLQIKLINILMEFLHCRVIQTRLYSTEQLSIIPTDTLDSILEIVDIHLMLVDILGDLVLNVKLVLVIIKTVVGGVGHGLEQVMVWLRVVFVAVRVARAVLLSLVVLLELDQVDALFGEGHAARVDARQALGQVLGQLLAGG